MREKVFSKETEMKIDKVLKMGDDIKRKRRMKAIDEYHILYEKARIWDNNSWLGVPCWKLPMDAFVIQELIVKLRPEFIIETGTGKGGSSMFYASICELLGEGKVITVDIENRVDHNKINEYEWSDRIKFIHGGSTNQIIVDKIKGIVGDSTKNMVILDSWHTKDHVYKEMLLYSPFVPVGGYMIVEDSHASGNPVPWEYDDEGPMGAINKWIDLYGDKWEVDFKCEKHLMTFNPKGWIKKIK